MYKLTRIIFVLLFVLLPVKSFSQYAAITDYTSQISEDYMRSTLSFLSDNLTRGRLTGTPGNIISASFLRWEFSRLGLTPFYSNTYTQSFVVDPATNGRNIIGVIPALYYTDEYIVVSAHYDHLGIIGGQIYNGADDNASGVTALLTIAQLFTQMKSDRQGPRKNIIFALFDAKEKSMSGSEFFVRNLPVKRSQITYNINIDQIGTTFAPPGDNPNYILYVADTRIREELKRRLSTIKRFYFPDMDIDHTFYGSTAFYEIFLRTSDQYSFIKAGIPALLFTSGIHMHTYKPTDVHYFIDYKVLMDRTRLIFHIIDNLSRYQRF